MLFEGTLYKEHYIYQILHTYKKKIHLILWYVSVKAK